MKLLWRRVRHYVVRPNLTYRSSKSKIWGLPERVGDLAQSAAKYTKGETIGSILVEVPDTDTDSEFEFWIM